MAHPTLATRMVESTDPSLSPEANRQLTHELRAVIGSDRVDVPTTHADHRSDRHATHSKLMAAAISVRIELMLAGLIVVMTAFISLGLVLENSWLLGTAFVLMLPMTGFIAWAVMRLFDEPEHLDPEVAAQLSAEGVGDPDHVFNELVHEFRGAARSD